MTPLSLRTKLWLPLAVAVVALVALSGISAYQARVHAYEARRLALRDMVDAADSLLNAIDADVKSAKLDAQSGATLAAERVGNLRYAGGSGYITSIRQDSVVVNNPASPKINGKDMSSFQEAHGFYLYREIASIGRSPAKAGYLSYWWPRPQQKEPQPKLAYVKHNDAWGWDLVAGDYVDDIEASFQTTLWWTGATLIGLLLLLSVIGSLVARSVVRDIGGEPGAVAAVAGRIANGDLRAARGGIDAAPGSILAAVEAMRMQLARLVLQIATSSNRIAEQSRELAAGSADLSHRTEQQASSLQETASSIEELTAAVKQSAHNANEVRRVALEAAAVADVGGTAVESVVATMNDIHASSNRITDIIGVIDGIAFQTNILALNAAVEAARAGEQGRGFAVVAGEVRALAKRSAEAAREIKSLIGASVDRIGSGTGLADRAGTTMREVVTGIRHVTSIIGEIATASQEQSTGIALVSSAISEIDKVTQQNAALVEQASASTQLLESEASALADTVRAFQLEGT